MTNFRLSPTPLLQSPSLFCTPLSYMGALKVAGPNNGAASDGALKAGGGDLSVYMSPTDPLPDSAPQRIRRDSRLDVDLQVPHIYTGELVQIDGDYEYVDEEAARLGQGAFGIVFRGRHRRSARAVAVKKLPTASMKPSELAVMQSLKSPYLVALIDVRPTPSMNCTYFVMELCDTDLDHHLTHCAVDSKLSGKNLRIVIDNVARGYDVLYDERIVHRDIKPHNILVQYKDNGSTEIRSAKIADFGISRVLEPDTENEDCAYEYLSNVAGTLSYMAPEVGANLLRTCQYDFQVDMWSIGCVLYQCISGQLPFDERSLCRLFLSAAGGNYDAYDKPELSPSTPPEVEAIVSALLEIDARKRPTPHEFYEMAVDWSSRHGLVAIDSS